MQSRTVCYEPVSIENVPCHRRRTPIHLISIQWYDFHPTHWPQWWTVHVVAVQQAVHSVIYRLVSECMQLQRPLVWLLALHLIFYRHICAVGCYIRRSNQAIILIIIHLQRQVCSHWAIIRCNHRWSLHCNMAITAHYRYVPIDMKPWKWAIHNYLYLYSMRICSVSSQFSIIMACDIRPFHLHGIHCKRTTIKFPIWL